jgi:putative Holliday junction resolvase
MRYLGIDFGTKRVGLALSDEGGSMAFPKGVVQNTKTLVEDIKYLCDEEGVGQVVIGESHDLDGTPNPLMKHIEQFIADWRSAVEIPIAKEPEFLTSHQAQKIQGKNDMIDASAATIILQSFLDRRAHNSN